MKKTTILNVDESPVNSDWLHTHWDIEFIPPYKSEEFFIWLTKSGMSLSDFKLTGRYQKAVRDGRIVDDQWVERIMKPE